MCVCGHVAGWKQKKLGDKKKRGGGGKKSNQNMEKKKKKVRWITIELGRVKRRYKQNKI